MTVSDSEIGKIYPVQEIRLDDKTKQRLEVIGMIGGSRIEIINRSRSGAVIVRVRGTRFALGKKIADNIIVADETGGVTDGKQHNSGICRKS